MICPHCKVAANFEFSEEETTAALDPDRDEYGHQVVTGTCPACRRLVVLLQSGRVEEVGSHGARYWRLESTESSQLLFPKQMLRTVEPEVPEEYRVDFLETCAVLPISAKASAAMSRRILQQILQQELQIQHGNLAKQIDQFIQRPDVPSYLSQAVDAVRNVGNYAAHPLKDTHSGEIVNVEPGEAEWLIEVLESLFDFTFVQPKRLAERRKKLNEKLVALGKPPMKG